MPHLTLEYTANIQQEMDSAELFAGLHQILATTGGTSIENCKSRAIRLENFHISRGAASDAFVHLEIHFMGGRSPEVQHAIGEQSLAWLTSYFTPCIDRLATQITVEITEIQKPAYFKFPSGTL